MPTSNDFCSDAILASDSPSLVDDPQMRHFGGCTNLTQGLRYHTGECHGAARAWIRGSNLHARPSGCRGSAPGTSRPAAADDRAEVSHSASSAAVKGLAGDAEMPTGARHTSGDSPARCNTLNRHAHNRVCSAFVIASPCRNFRQTKTPLTLPSLWTHRTRPQGLGNYKTVSTAPTALIFCSKNSNPNRREPGVSSLSWDFTSENRSHCDETALVVTPHVT